MSVSVTSIAEILSFIIRGAKGQEYPRVVVRIGTFSETFHPINQSLTALTIAALSLSFFSLCLSPDVSISRS